MAATLLWVGLAAGPLLCLTHLTRSLDGVLYVHGRQSAAVIYHRLEGQMVSGMQWELNRISLT